MFRQNFQFEFGGIQPFWLNGSYSNISESPDLLVKSHIHSECEIYINLTGDVSFMVEDRVYPITRGSAVITRPYEYHHCIYHSRAEHEHFWILFSADGNENLLKCFFRRPLAVDNLVVLPLKERESLIELCYDMMAKDISEAEKYACFFKMLSLLETGQKSSEVITQTMPEDVRTALCYLRAHLSDKISVDALAELSHVSVSSLERHFRENLQVTPSGYLKQIRLANAARLLKGGMNVSEACEQSGFTDYSHFIKLFKEEFGITPLQYRKGKRNRR